jgi:glycosyltransferase involved in cell wall biosynthesis
MSKAKVAVITRTSNRPFFLERAIRSVAAQTYTDYTHVIINDGAPRESIESIVNGFDEDTLGHIVVFHRNDRSDAPDTILTESVDYIDSEYVAIHDDDDTWHPDFLKKTVERLDQGASGVVVKTDKVVERLTQSGIIDVSRKPYMPDMEVISLYRQCIDNQLTPISFIYRRDAYETVGKYDASLPVVGDWEFGLRFLRAFDVEFIDPGFALANYHHRENGNNSFTKHNHRKYFTHVANMYLREELNAGQYGLGHIISRLKYEQAWTRYVVENIDHKFTEKF